MRTAKLCVLGLLTRAVSCDQEFADNRFKLEEDSQIINT